MQHGLRTAAAEIRECGDCISGLAQVALTRLLLDSGALQAIHLSYEWVGLWHYPLVVQIVGFLFGRIAITR